MKRIFAMALAMTFLGTLLNAQLHPDYENPRVFERNQVLPHATLMPYPSSDLALKGERKSSPFHLNLNGPWQFHWAENPAEAPADFYKSGSNRDDWQTIGVPSNWQMEGFGFPLFRNIGLPHPLDPPEVPKQFNPTGSYYRTFDLPEDWNKRQVFLHFEGVHSASYVWINGKEVGYNQGGMEPAEYDISPFLKKGENSIAVRVLRYSDGAYLEDQDTWRLSGIYRNVYLISTPLTHIRDFYVSTDLDKSYEDASLNVAMWVKNYSQKNAGPYSIRTNVYDLQGEMLPEGKGIISTGTMDGGAGEGLELSLEISNPDKWSAEYPNLYTLVMELMDGEEVLEVLSTRVGFREVEIIDQAICVNGVPIKFNGVNSHMLHPETGHTMDVETIRKDFYLMKQFNINCVRTSHYPPNVEYLDLADELGIYIVDETGDEAHAYTELSHDPEWRDQYLDRMRKMVYRDRNHASVVIWSAGNESGSGDNICALIAEGKEIDPSRFWLYGGNRDRDPLTNPVKCEDVVGPRYLQPFLLEQRFGKSDDPRPSFMDEYIAVTGNSLGGMDEYWELIYKYRRLTGGAIWDWMSPGITQPVVSTPDDSPSGIKCVFMNKAHLVPGETGQALYLSGHDDWLEVSRDPSLDISGEALTLSFHVKPEAYNGNAAFLTKGDYQYGVIQSDDKHLEFYLNTGAKASLKGELPGDWEGRWHHVAATYDGSKMELFVDGELMGSQAHTGLIRNAPYQVILGKSAELRDSHLGYMGHATLDQVRIFDWVVPLTDLNSEAESLKARSLLWLDFESKEEEGSYYSIGIPGRTYGVVWPDRSIQPEMWQMKKSPQPVHFTAKDLEQGSFEITNRYHFRNLKELNFRWELTVDGVFLQKGTFKVDLEPGEKQLVDIPYMQPEVKSGTVCHLLISGSTGSDFPWAAAGHEVAWEQFEFPVRNARPTAAPIVADQQDPALDILEMLKYEHSLEVKGADFTYVFDRKTGVLTSMVIEGRELISKGLRLNVWRAPLANDLDSWNFWRTEMGHVTEGMGQETANGWRSIGLDRLEQEVDQFRSEMGHTSIRVHIEASLHSMNYTTGFKVFYDYTIWGDGEIEIATRVSARGNMTKWIPKVGLQMELPREYQQMEWFGRGPFENYPDRKTGAKTGIYQTSVEEDFVPYIIPQDYGNRCDVRWFKLTDRGGSGLLVSSDELFNVSAQKYTTENLDRAHYPFQLKEEEVVTLNLDHLVTGVGGTANSVLNPYRVAPGEFEFTFRIKPVVE
ncbi:MAG: glycoside hydrolase family 2 [Bacteroidetes bacterium]|nr:MAG: glycoside hydrolase family 2 [Bacteroidota bacterium]